MNPTFKTTLYRARNLFFKKLILIDNHLIQLVFSNNICVYLSQGQSKIQYTRVTHNSKNENILCRYVLTFLALKGGANVIILNNTEQKLNKYQILVRRLKISKPLLTGFFFRFWFNSGQIAQPVDIAYGQTELTRKEILVWGLWSYIDGKRIEKRI